MDLYIIRHAWAADRGDPQWSDDNLRPLTDVGQERFAAMVAKLAKRGFAPEIIAASPLVRCVQTAELVAAGTDGKAEIVEVDALRPGSDLETLMRWTTRQVGEFRRFAWVGHAPDVDRMTGRLIGADDGLIRFAKGAVAALRFDGPLEIGAAELRWLATGKVLGC